MDLFVKVTWGTATAYALGMYVTLSVHLAGAFALMLLVHMVIEYRTTGHVTMK